LLSPLKNIETRVHYKRWEKAGKPIPPPYAVKRVTIDDYRRKNAARILVETGTYTGEMVFIQLRNFDRIYSIELADYYYEKAAKRFRRYDKVKLLHGDSAVKLKTITCGFTEPVLFWLDGHYSGGITAKGNLECPIFDELDAILSSPYNHTILIDDAHCFVGAKDYPTIDEVKHYLQDKHVNHTFKVQNNIIIIEIKISE